MKKRYTFIISITLVLVLVVGNWYYAAYKSAMRKAVSLNNDALSYEDGEEPSEISNEGIPEGTEQEISNEETSGVTVPETGNEEIPEGTDQEISNEEIPEGTEPKTDSEEIPESTAPKADNEETPESTAPKANNEEVSGNIKSEISNDKISEGTKQVASNEKIYNVTKNDTSETNPSLNSDIDEVEVLDENDIDILGATSNVNVNVILESGLKYTGEEQNLIASTQISPSIISGYTIKYGISKSENTNPTDWKDDFNDVKGKDVGTYYVFYGEFSSDAVPKPFDSPEPTATECVGSVTISPASMTVTWGDETSFEYDGKPHAPGIIDEIDGVNGEKLHITRTTNTDSGNYTSTASISSVTGGQAKSENYKITNSEMKYSITQRSLNNTDMTIELDQNTYTYDGTEHEPAVIVTDISRGVALVEDSDYTLTYYDNKNAGTAKVTVTGTGNYTGSVEKTFTIDRRPVTVTPDNKTVKVGEQDAVLTYTADGVVAGETLKNINLVRNPYSNEIGSYYIEASADSEANPNYDITFNNGTYYIIPNTTEIEITLSQSDVGYIYSGKAYEPAITVKDKDNKKEIPVNAYKVNYTNNKNAGTATITVSDIPDEKVYNIEAKSITFTIIPRPITVEAEDKTKGYGDEDPTFTYKVVEGELAENDELTDLIYKREKGDELGTYSIDISQKAGANPNYDIMFMGGATLTITKNTIKNATVNGIEAVYDGEPHKLDVTIPDNATITYGIVPGEYILPGNPGFTDAGAHTVYYKIEIDNNYEAIEGSKDVVISPKKITLTTTDSSKDYGEDDPTFDYTVEGLIGDDTLEGVTITRESGEDAGEYQISASVDKDKNPNYDITIVNSGKFTIEKDGTVEITNPETPNAGGATLEESSEGIISKVELTDEEKEAQEDGKNIYIFLEVGDISNSVSAADKKLVEDFINNSSFEKLGIEADKSDAELKIGMYLDINLFKQVEGDDKVKISETSGPVKVAFEIPESLRKDDRIFYIVRIHDGAATLITPSQSGNTLTFETDQFSTYALVYIDKAESSKSTDTKVDTPTTEATQTTEVNTTAEATPGKSTSANTVASPKTGDGFNAYILICMIISFLGVVYLMIIRKKN